MEDFLSIYIRLAGQDHKFQSNPGSETYLREAGRLLNERLKEFVAQNKKEQSALAMLAITYTAAWLMEKDNQSTLQEKITERVNRLDEFIDPLVGP